MIKFLANHRPTDRQWAAGAILFCAYFLAVVSGSRIFTSSEVISAAAGVGLAGLVLEGIDLWPALYLSALAAYLFDHSGRIFPFVAVILPIAQTGQAVVGAALLKALKCDRLFNHIRDGIIFICVAIAASAIVPSLGFLAYFLNRAAFGTNMPVIPWTTWWCGTIASVIVVAPFLIRWIVHPRFTRDRRDWIEISAVFAALLVIIIPASFTSISEVGGVSLVYLLLVPLFWIAIRFGPRFMTLGNLIVGGCGLAGLYWGTTAVTNAANIGLVVFETQVLIITLSCIFLVLMGGEEERKETLTRLRSRMEHLEDEFGAMSFRDRTKSEFIAILAHELRNPLAPLVSSIDLLRLERGVSERHAPILDEMDARVHTIRRLLDDILDISRISQNKLYLKKEYMELQAVIGSAIRAVEGKISERRQHLSVNMVERPIYVNADPVRIEQVITNILMNAVKFTRPGGNIWISVYQEGMTAEVHIKDDGVGIDPSMTHRIFEPFLQVEGKRANDGLGIGLALSKQLMEMHDGSIEARSKGQGQGSEFIVRLPLLADDESNREWLDESGGSEVAGGASGNRRVLVVDDNATAAKLLGRLLSHLGYTVRCVGNGVEALDQTAHFRPEIIVLDIGLPDMDGYEIALMIRERLKFPGTLIALTGYGQEEDRAKAYAAGFDHHLTKPVSIAELQRVLQ